MRPETFDADLSEQWSEWVLDHGLPELRGLDLDAGQSVPVAYWVGPTAGAVAHIKHTVSDRHAEPIIEHEVDQYLRVEGTWMPELSSGGPWGNDPPLDRRQTPLGHVALDKKGGGWGERGGSKALWGEVGRDAAFAEVHQAGKVVRRPVEAPVGLFVVCAVYANPFTVRVLDAHDRVLAELEEPAGFDDDSAFDTVRSRATLRERLFGRRRELGR